MDGYVHKCMDGKMDGHEKIQCFLLIEFVSINLLHTMHATCVTIYCLSQ